MTSTHVETSGVAVVSHRSPSVLHPGPGPDTWPGRLKRLISDRGAVSPFIVILLPALVGFAGLAYDGGQLFAARREAVNVAAASARAGVNDLDEASIHAGDPKLASSAPVTAQAFALRQGVDSASATRVDDDRIRVEVKQSVEMAFLTLLGVGTQTIDGQAEAVIKNGV